MALHDILEEYRDQREIIAALEDDAGGTPNTTLRSSAVVHGGQLLRLGFSLDSVADER